MRRIMKLSPVSFLGGWFKQKKPRFSFNENQLKNLHKAALSSAILSAFIMIVPPVISSFSILPLLENLNVCRHLADTLLSPTPYIEDTHRQILELIRRLNSVDHEITKLAMLKIIAASFSLILLVASICSTVLHFRYRAEMEKKLATYAQMLQIANDQLELLAKMDPLTEVLNRRGLTEMLQIEVARSLRHENRIYALLLDCDDFKNINENFGHSGGDFVLKHVADSCKAATRPTDLVSRIGGDEFLVILGNSSLTIATIVAERIRSKINVVLSIGKTSCLPSVSIACVDVPLNEPSIDTILVGARDALKRGKGTGKNIVVVAESATERQ